MSTRRLTALLLLAILAGLFAGISARVGLGHPAVPDHAVAIVEGVDGDPGTITSREFHRGLRQQAIEAKLNGLPSTGRQLRERTMSVLLDRIWLPRRAAELGIVVRDSDISNAFQAFKMEHFKTDFQFRRFQDLSEYTRAEKRQDLVVQLLARGIEAKVEDADLSPSSPEVEAFYEERGSIDFSRPDGILPLEHVRKKIEAQLIQRAQFEAARGLVADYFAIWVRRTFCAPAVRYVRCADFERDPHPQVEPSCYEADPHNKRPKSCAAPVIQSIPALPGTVSVFEPRGVQLPQRPRPAT